MKIKTQTYTLPAYWASYLINGDASGLDAAEKIMADNFLRNTPGHPVDCSEESWFQRYNDANALAGDVLDYSFYMR